VDGKINRDGETNRGAEINREEELTRMIRNALDSKGQLPCASAFRIAEILGIVPLQVGRMANKLSIHLNRCQLGLFGYSENKTDEGFRLVEPMADVPSDLEAAIRDAWSGEGITCAQAWAIADRLPYSKRDVADACQGLGAKITICQLGAFPRSK